MREVLPTLERWAAEGLRAAIATVVSVERSAPRDPGATLAVAESGEVAGSVTGGCVEPAIYEEARDVLAGGAPRLKTYGIADEEAFEVGLSCGGTVRIFVSMLDQALLAPLAAALRDDRAVALTFLVSGPEAGAARLVSGDAEPEGEADRRAQELLALGETAVVEVEGEDVFVSSFAPPEIRDPEERVWGDVGVLTCWLEQSYTMDGSAQQVSAPTTLVFRQEGGAWKIALFHSIPLPEQH